MGSPIIRRIPRHSKKLRFGVFEADLAAGELRRSGYRLRIQKQPFEVLVMLLERPLEIVSRDEIFAKIWPTATFGDLEQALNKAISKIREVLGDASETPRFVETVARRGYRFIASVEAAEVYLPFVAVLPFKNIGSVEEDFFSEGLTEEILTVLSGVEGLRVLASASTRQFHADSPTEDLRNRVDVTEMLIGSIRRYNNRVRIVATLLDSSTGEQRWSKVFDRELTDLFVIQEEIARGIADTLRINLTGKAGQKQLVRCANTVEAYDLYLKGLYHFRRRLPADISKAISFLEEAIAADPNYAPAHAAKAEAYGLLWFTGQGKRENVVPVALNALATALRLEPNLPEARALSAYVNVLRNWDWVGAGLAFERALELDDRSPSLHWKHAMWFLAPTGRMSEALAEIDWAMTFDPLSALVVYMKALVLWCDRQYRMAEMACEQALMIDPDFGLSRVLLGSIYQQTGRHAQAIRAFEETLAHSGSDSRTLSRLAAVYAEAGRRDDALQILADLKRSSTDVPAWTLGWIHLCLDDHAEAFRHLEIGIEKHDPGMMWLKVHPDFDRLRTHPQFASLLHHVGLSF